MIYCRVQAQIGHGIYKTATKQDICTQFSIPVDSAKLKEVYGDRLCLMDHAEFDLQTSRALTLTFPDPGQYTFYISQSPQEFIEIGPILTVLIPEFLESVNFNLMSGSWSVVSEKHSLTNDPVYAILLQVSIQSDYFLLLVDRFRAWLMNPPSPGLILGVTWEFESNKMPLQKGVNVTMFLHEAASKIHFSMVAQHFNWSDYSTSRSLGIFIMILSVPLTILVKANIEKNQKKLSDWTLELNGKLSTPLKSPLIPLAILPFVATAGASAKMSCGRPGNGPSISFKAELEGLYALAIISDWSPMSSIELTLCHRPNRAPIWEFNISLMRPNHHDFLEDLKHHVKRGYLLMNHFIKPAQPGLLLTVNRKRVRLSELDGMLEDEFCQCSRVTILRDSETSRGSQSALSVQVSDIQVLSHLAEVLLENATSKVVVIKSDATYQMIWVMSATPDSKERTRYST